LKSSKPLEFAPDKPNNAESKNDVRTDAPKKIFANLCALCVSALKLTAQNHTTAKQNG
jgi:hypothetical protein